MAKMSSTPAITVDLQIRGNRGWIKIGGMFCNRNYQDDGDLIELNVGEEMLYREVLGRQRIFNTKIVIE